ncbi:MAG: vWA domain-containing protein, partial [Acidimicrobiia bacterium]
MRFLAPAALALAALAGPLIVLYKLRTRRRRVEVPSTLLWEQVGPDVSSAVPWQRLRATPLLLLQLAVLAAFVLTLARPFFTQQTLLGPHTVMVIDTSGSMAMAGRLDRAKARAGELAGDASRENLVSVVEAGPRARVLAAFAQDPGAVRAAVEGLRPTGGTEDLEEALRLARGLATPDRSTGILLFTDGGIPATLPEEPVVGATHLLFDAVGDNLAVTALSAEPSTEGAFRAFLEVANHTGEERAARVEIRVDGLSVGFVDLVVPAGGRGREVVPLDAGPGQLVEARLVGEPDALPLDDTAWLVVGSGPDRRVAILGEGSPFLRALVDIAPGFTTETGEAADLLIVDGGPLPEIDRPAWVIRTVTPPEGMRVSELVRNAVATYQRPGEPILDDVDLSGLAVAEAQVVETASWLPLVRAGEVPLVLLGEVGGHRVVYFTFDLTHSNLPVEVAFPILGARLLEWLAGGSAVAAPVEEAGAP